VYLTHHNESITPRRGRFVAHPEIALSAPVPDASPYWVPRSEKPDLGTRQFHMARFSTQDNENDLERRSEGRKALTTAGQKTGATFLEGIRGWGSLGSFRGFEHRMVSSWKWEGAVDCQSLGIPLQ